MAEGELVRRIDCGEIDAICLTDGTQVPLWAIEEYELRVVDALMQAEDDEADAEEDEEQ